MILPAILPLMISELNHRIILAGDHSAFKFVTSGSTFHTRYDVVGFAMEVITVVAEATIDISWFSEALPFMTRTGWNTSKLKFVFITLTASGCQRG